MSFILLTILLSLSRCVSSGASPHANKTESLLFAVMVPYSTDEDAFESGVMVAMEDINEDPHILPGRLARARAVYSMKLVGSAFAGMYNLMEEEQPIAGIIGPTFSRECDAMVKFNQKYFVPQVGFSALSISENSDSPAFFAHENVLRTNPTGRTFARARLAFVKLMKWKRISMLYDTALGPGQDPYKAAKAFSRDVTANGITVVDIMGFSSSQNGSELDSTMRTLKDHNARVIMLFSNDQAALRLVMCQAYMNRMYGPKYVWLLASLINIDWWDNLDEEESACTPSELLQAAYGNVQMVQTEVRTDGKPNISGKKSSDVLARILEAKKKRFATSREGQSRNFSMILDFNPTSTYSYDATYALALALDVFSRHHPYDKVQYGDRVYFETVMKYLHQLSFEGITGRVSFDNMTGERKDSFITVYKWLPDLKNFTNVPEKLSIGIYSSEKDRIELTNSISAIFPAGIPKDGYTKRSRVVTYSVPTLVTIWTIAAGCVMMALVFLTINVWKRDVRIIKMSSPNINNAIILGSIASYLAVILYGLDSRTVSVKHIPLSCNITALTLALGFTLTFGSLFSKTWRVFKIFTASKTLKKVKIQDYHLYLFILFLVAVDVSVFVVWMVFSPFKLHTQLIESKEIPETDVLETAIFHRCVCKNQLEFTVFLFVFKGVLLLFGLFIAWETRHVKVAVLSDSKYIGMSVYNVCVISVIGVTSATSLHASKNFEMGYVVVALCVLLSTTVTLLLIFGPKLYLLATNQNTSFTFTSSTKVTSKGRTVKVNFRDVPESVTRMSSAYESSMLEKDNESSLLERLDENVALHGIAEDRQNSDLWEE